MPSWILETTRCELCGKLSYESRDDAEYATKKMLVPMAAYKCLYGNGWHLTTVRKRGRAADADARDQSQWRKRVCP
jgi:hypothetical protein